MDFDPRDYTDERDPRGERDWDERDRDDDDFCIGWRRSPDSPFASQPTAELDQAASLRPPSHTG
jgi:hypothetical protein